MAWFLIEVLLKCCAHFYGFVLGLDRSEHGLYIGQSIATSQWWGWGWYENRLSMCVCTQLNKLMPAALGNEV